MVVLHGLTRQALVVSVKRTRLSVACKVFPGYPLKLHFQIPCVFPVRQQIFPVSIYVICDYNIHKTDLADLSSLNLFWRFSRKIWKYLLTLESGNLQLEQTKFPVFWKNSIFLGPFSLFSLCSGYPVFPSHTRGPGSIPTIGAESLAFWYICSYILV